MSAAATARSEPRLVLSLDVSWRNIVFSVRTALAAICALALAYWLELSDPQWATLTVYILAQPTVGAAIAKGVWRALGTLLGGILGLVLVAFFSQAAELLVVVTSTLVGLSFYAGSRLRNTVAYGFLLGGYTMVLVSFEGSAHPLNAWLVAVDRTSEILIGIACSTIASAIVWPRYAGDVLREALGRTFSGLTTYVAVALRAQASPALFAQMRKRMVADVAAFDALRSSTLFEAAEMRPNGQRLRRIVNEFLALLSIARGLYRRVDEFAQDEAKSVLERLRPTLESVAMQIERLGMERPGRDSARDLHRELLRIRGLLRSTATSLENMLGAAPFEALVDGLLILRRTNDVLHTLAMVFLTTTTMTDGRPARIRRAGRQNPEGRREALLLGARAALAILLLSSIWMATGWNEGFTAVSGGAIVLLLGVNQDNPKVGARAYLVWSTIGTAFGYIVLILVAPHLQGFGALAVVLLLILLPAGLMAGTPAHTMAGIAFGGFTISQIAIGNVFKPDEVALINGAFALILGMVICLGVVSIIPVTSRSQRRQAWHAALGVILPEVARGARGPRRGAREITDMLASLLPRLALNYQSEEDYLRGMLGAASMSVELGRLTDVMESPSLPPTIAADLALFLKRFAGALEDIARRPEIPLHMAEAEAAVAWMRSRISALTPEANETARSILNASASLRFLADRFEVDRAFFEYSFSRHRE